MDRDLTAFRDAWAAKQHDLARAIASAYVAAHRHEIGPLLEPLTRDELVTLVTDYRNAGREEDRIVADMWLLNQYAPLTIVGSMNMGGR